MQLVSTPSPNFNERRERLDMLVLHYTGMETGADALDRMCDADAEVSAHYMIEEGGTICQLVPEEKRAWHAGVSSWQGDQDLNSRSIGIEIVNGGHNFPLESGELPPYPPAQIDAVIALCRDILDRNAIPQHRIVGHSDIAPDRKDDPGEHFPWQKLSEHGIGFWPEPAGTGQLMGKGLEIGASGPAVERLQTSLRDIGYGVDVNGIYGDTTVHVVRAFQRRWCPDRVTGEADLTSMTLIERVAEFARSSTRAA